MESVAMTYLTNPLQSNPRCGDWPPSTYRRPIWARARATIESRMAWAEALKLANGA